MQRITHEKTRLGNALLRARAFALSHHGHDREDEKQLAVSDATSQIRSGHIENVTVAEDNYLGADFVMPGDYVADAILPAYALQQIASGKDVDLWLESTREEATMTPRLSRHN